jgi:hypothetical protein
MAGDFRVQDPVDRWRDIPPTWLLSLLGAWQLTSGGRTVDLGTYGCRIFALAMRVPCDRSYLSGALWLDLLI